MPDPEDQTQTTEDEVKTEETLAAEAAEQEAVKEEETATAAAVKTSTDFDKKVDAEGVEDDTPPADESGSEEDDAAAKTGEAAKKDDKKAVGEEEDTAATEDQTGKAGAEKDATSDEGLKVSEELAQKGRDIGLLDEEIAGFENEAALEYTISLLQKVAQEPEPQAAAAQQPATKPAKAAEKATKDDNGDGFELKFKDEADIDPEILANFKGLNKALVDSRAENKSLREEVEGMTTRTNRQEADRFMVRFDGMVDKLGDDMTDTLGKGATNTLSTRSGAHRNRTAIRKNMLAIGTGFADTGQDIPSEQRLFDLSVHSLHGEQMKKQSGARMKGKTDKRSKQAIGRPATRRTGSLTPDQKAVETSKKFDDLVDTAED